MKHHFTNTTWIIAVMIAILFLSACSTPNQVPTPEPTIEAPTEEIEFFLTAKKLPVSVIGEDGTESDLTAGEIVSVHTGNTISVGATGLAELQAGKRLTVEIFNGTELQVSTASTNTNGSATISMNQDHGQTRFTVPEGANTTIILSTIFQKISNLTG